MLWVFSLIGWQQWWGEHPDVHAWGLPVIIGIFIIQAFWFSFEKFDDMEKKFNDLLKPQLEIECSNESEGCVVPNLHDGGNLVNIGYRLRVTVNGGKEINGCKATLLKISKDGKARWKGNTAALTFYPSADQDCHHKTVIPGIPSYVDVLFLIFKFHLIYDGATFDGIMMGTKNNAWGTLPSPHSIFDEHGEYHLDISLSANGMATLPVTVVFTFSKRYAESLVRLL